jgi:hypothetical protein
MPTDIKLDEGDGNWMHLECNVVKITASDFMLDSSGRKQSAGHRRALVHDQQDGLTINFNGDYPGGVTVDGSLTVSGDLRSDVLTELKGQVAELKAQIDELRGIQQVDPRRVDRLENNLDALIDFVGAAIVPPWRTREEVENGDDMGVLYQSADRLGLRIEYQIDQHNPNYEHEEVISLNPPAGTMLRQGSTVVVEINLEH